MTRYDAGADGIVAQRHESARAGSTVPCDALPRRVALTGNDGFLSRTAGDLRDVLRKRLRGELQPLDHREIRKELVREIVHRQSGPNDHDRALDDLTSSRRDQQHSQQSSAGHLGNRLITPQVLELTSALGTRLSEPLYSVDLDSRLSDAPALRSRR